MLTGLFRNVFRENTINEIIFPMIPMIVIINVTILLLIVKFGSISIHVGCKGYIGGVTERCVRTGPGEPPFVWLVVPIRLYCMMFFGARFILFI